MYRLCTPLVVEVSVITLMFTSPAVWNTDPVPPELVSVVPLISRPPTRISTRVRVPPLTSRCPLCPDCCPRSKSADSASVVAPVTDAVPPLLISAASLVAIDGIRAKSQFAGLSQSPLPTFVHVIGVGVCAIAVTPAAPTAKAAAAVTIPCRRETRPALDLISIVPLLSSSLSFDLNPPYRYGPGRPSVPSPQTVFSTPQRHIKQTI